MKASDIAFYLLCINISISLVNATGVFSYSQTVGEDFEGEDWNRQIDVLKDEEVSFLREGASVYEEVTGLATVAIQGMKNFVLLVLGAILGIGGLMNNMGIPENIGTNVDRLTIFIYFMALVEKKVGRGET